MGYRLKIRRSPHETREHYILKVATINELVRMGFSIDQIVLEKYYPNMNKTFLTDFYFASDYEDNVEKIGREKLVFHKCYTRSFIDIVLETKPIVFFECLTKFPMASQWHLKIKSLELCALTNRAKLIFVVPSKIRSFRKLNGVFLDGIWLVSLKEGKVVAKIGEKIKFL